MRYLIPLLLSAAFAPLAMADDNIASCEVILLQEIKDEEMQGSAQVASYRPAADFIASVYDDEDGHMTEIDDNTIRGVMCTRKSVIPTEFDFPIIATGVPLSLSQNFESTTSGLITIFYGDGKFEYQYGGPDLTEAEQTMLDDRMEILNFQPHDLKDKKKKKAAKDTLQLSDVEIEDGLAQQQNIEQQQDIEIVTIAPEGRQDYEIVLKPKADELGITAQIISNLIQENLGFEAVDEGEDIVVRGPDDDSDPVLKFDKFILFNDAGDEFPLSDMAELQVYDPS